MSDDLLESSDHRLDGLLCRRMASKRICFRKKIALDGRRFRVEFTHDVDALSRGLGKIVCGTESVCLPFLRDSYCCESFRHGKSVEQHGSRREFVNNLRNCHRPIEKV